MRATILFAILRAYIVEIGIIFHIQRFPILLIPLSPSFSFSQRSFASFDIALLHKLVYSIPVHEINLLLSSIQGQSCNFDENKRGKERNMEVAQTREERADLSHESVHAILLNLLGILYDSFFRTH